MFIKVIITYCKRSKQGKLCFIRLQRLPRLRCLLRLHGLRSLPSIRCLRLGLGK